MQIAFIGLGSMGTGMALNLVKAGHDVRAWNRSKLDPGMVPGVTLVESAAEAFQADAVFTMLSDDLALKDMRLATEAGNDIGRTLPMLEAVRERLGQAVSEGFGEKDWSIIAELAVRGDPISAPSDRISEKKQ